MLKWTHFSKEKEQPKNPPDQILIAKTEKSWPRKLHRYEAIYSIKYGFTVEKSVDYFKSI